MRASYRFLRACLPVLAVAAVAASPIQGQESDRDWKVPHKNGHAFSPAVGVPDAFVRSYIRNEIGIASTYDIDIPLGIVDGDTLFASRGSLLFANLAFEYQQTIRDWIAIRGRFRVLGRLGTGTSALLSSGVSATTGFELGWLIRLLETDRSYLSLDLSVKRNDFTLINIADFVRDVIDGEDAELTRKTPSMRAGGGLRFTHALSPLVGLIGFVDTGYGESVDRLSDDEWFFRFGGTVDFDLAAANWWPVGLAAGYYQDSFPEGGADLAEVLRSFVFRLGYTGRKDLALGLNLVYSIIPTDQFENRLKSLGGSLDLRYYF